MKRNSWNYYQKLVTEKLEEHSEKLDKVQDNLVAIQIEIATLKVKSGVWGAIGSAVVILLFFGINYYVRRG